MTSEILLQSLDRARSFSLSPTITNMAERDAAVGFKKVDTTLSLPQLNYNLIVFRFCIVKLLLLLLWC